MQYKELIHTDNTPISKQDIIWESKPSFIPYLLCSEKMTILTIIWFLIFWHFDFAWFLPTKIWGCFWLYFLISGIVYWHNTHYYLTKDYLVINIGKKYHRISYNDIIGYHVYSYPSAYIFRCRTFRFNLVSCLLKGSLLTYCSPRDAGTDVKDKISFQCIKDWEKVDQLITERV